MVPGIEGGLLIRGQYVPKLPITTIAAQFEQHHFNLSQAQLFLNCLDPTADRFLFVLINPDRQSEPPKAAFVEPSAAFNDLMAWNSQGYGVYVNVNQTEGVHRRRENITRCRAVFIEDDNKTRSKPYPINPNLVVESSPGKYHIYYLTSTTVFDQYEEVQQTLVNDYGGDPNARDISRILRVPGFYNTKSQYDSWPIVKLLTAHPTPYSWEQLITSFPPSPVTRRDGTFKGAPIDLSETWKLFLSGDDYHRAGISLIGYYYNSGVVDRGKLIELMQAQMEVLGDQTDPRYLHRRDKDIPASVDWVLKERGTEVVTAPVVDFNETSSFKVVPWPPGLMGQMCREINEMAHHPNQSIAVVAGVALVAGIVGRTYNVRGTGLNMFISLLANTGVGKELITRAINHAFMDGYIGEGAASFRGPGRFTGPRGIIKSLQQGMSQICVMTEAGLLNASTAGDGSGITRTLLSLYTRSGKLDWTQTEIYSNEDESIPSLNAPALSIIAESTPQTFIQGFLSSKADVNGEMARTWIVRLKGDKEKLQRITRTGFSQPVAQQLKQLIGICAPNQLSPTPQAVYDIDIPEPVYHDSDRLTQRENRFKHEGKAFEQATTSRAWIKQVKLSAICSIFNNPVHLQLQEDAYNWACKVVDKEIQEIHDSLTHENSADLHTVVGAVIVPVIYKVLHNGYKDKKKQVVYTLRKVSIVTRTALHQALVNNRTLKELDTANGRTITGLDKILGHMCEVGYLRRIEKAEMMQYGTRFNVGYQITDDLVTTFPGVE